MRVRPPSQKVVRARRSAVLLGAAERRRLQELLAAAVVSEPCGYLIGELLRAEDVEQEPGTRAEVVRVRAVHAGRNVHPTPREAWALDPAEQLEVSREARGQDLAVVGFWHGHLVGPARPGAADFAGRAPLGPHVHVICARAGSTAPYDTEIRGWLADCSGFVELPINEPEAG